MKGTAEEFMAVKEVEFKEFKNIRFKDINRVGWHIFRREAWVFHIQHNLPEKVFVLERLKKIGTEGRITHKNVKIGDIEYRFGYFIVAKIRKRKGYWIWAQFCPLIPKADWKALLLKAKKEGVIL